MFSSRLSTMISIVVEELWNVFMGSIVFVVAIQDMHKRACELEMMTKV